MWSLSCRTYTCPACQTLDGVHVLKALRSAINSSGKWRKNGTRLSTRPYRRNGVDALYTLSHQGLRNCQKSEPTSIGKNWGMLSSETIGRRIFLGHPLVVSEGENGDRHKMVGIVLRVWSGAEWGTPRWFNIYQWANLDLLTQPHCNSARVATRPVPPRRTSRSDTAHDIARINDENRQIKNSRTIVHKPSFSMF